MHIKTGLGTCTNSATVTVAVQATSRPPLKLVLVYNSDPRGEHIGGIRRYMRFLMKEALRKGAKVRFIGVKMVECPAPNPEVSFTPLFEADSLKAAHQWWRYLLISMIKGPFVRFQPDEIIHTGRLLYLLPYCIWNRRNIKICTTGGMPQTVSAAACPTWAFRILSAMYAPIESFILNRTDAVLSARHVIEDYFQSSYPDLKDRFRPDIDPGSGVDLELFQPRDRKEVRKELGIPHDEKVVLFVGRLDPVKALDFQIDAFNSFASRVPNSRFLIVGEDWSEGYYQQYAQGYPQLHIQFLGEKRGLELAKMYNCADLLIIGSKHEGNSTVLREALCSGLGVVTTDVGDARELLTDPQMGEIVPFREPDVFAESMIRMFGRDSEDARKVRLGIVSLLSDEAVFQPIFDLYRELLAARGIVPEEENPGTG